MSSRRSGRAGLRDLTGIGAARAKSLERAGFRTIEDVDTASDTDLQGAQGIGGSLATKIKLDATRFLGGELLDPDADAEGAINAKHDELGGSDGRLGPPVADVQVNADDFGRRRHYENGRIYWSRRTGAHALFDGPILEEWERIGAERAEPGSLRYPTGDEQETTDGTGRLQHFYGGVIFWTGETGAIVVRDLPRSPPKTVLFKHRLRRQGGEQKRFVVEQSFDDLGLVNAKDKATSLYVPDGWVVTLFDKPKYRGDMERMRGPMFIERLHDLKRSGGKNWDNAIASLHVDQRSPEAEAEYRAEPQHGELVIRWAGAVSNGEGPSGDKIGITGHGPVGNFHVLIYEEDVRQPRKENSYRSALRHVVLPGPSDSEWDDGDQMFYGADSERRPKPEPFEEGPLCLFRWRNPDDAVAVFVYESDPNPFDEHDPIFFARVRRADTLNGSRQYVGETKVKVNQELELLPTVLDRARRRGAKKWLLESTDFGELEEGMPNMFADLETVDRADRYFDREGNTDWRHLQTFEHPMYGGYRLDWCLERAKKCGQPAAEEWARKMFLNFQEFPGAVGIAKSDRVRDFEKAENVGLTRIVSSDELCTSRGCDSFARITIG